MEQITYFYESTDFRLDEADKTNNWISNTIINNQKSTGEINYVFCNDEYLLDINRKYLQHDTLTDIITFNQSEDPQIISGDIYISIDRIAENAGVFKVSFDEELRRVMIHGILHLIGYNDKSEEEQHEMRNKENHYLALW